MPCISTFYGVVLCMYWNERDHPVANFHAYHAGRRASVPADGTVLAGSLEPRAPQFVLEWAALRHKEILANCCSSRATTRHPHLQTCAAERTIRMLAARVLLLVPMTGRRGRAYASTLIQPSVLDLRQSEDPDGCGAVGIRYLTLVGFARKQGRTF